MWFIITWSDDTDYNDLFFVVGTNSVPRKWRTEQAAKAWAKRNCASNFKIIFVE